MAKEKSSVVLEKALEMIKSGDPLSSHGSLLFVCAAINWIEMDVIPKQRSRALERFQKFKPKEIQESMKGLQQWWPKEDKAARIDALERCIAQAKKEND